MVTALSNGSQKRDEFQPQCVKAFIVTFLSSAERFSLLQSHHAPPVQPVPSGRPPPALRRRGGSAGPTKVPPAPTPSRTATTSIAGGGRPAPRNDQVCPGRTLARRRPNPSALLGSAVHPRRYRTTGAIIEELSAPLGVHTCGHLRPTPGRSGTFRTKKPSLRIRQPCFAAWGFATRNSCSTCAGASKAQPIASSALLPAAQPPAAYPTQPRSPTHKSTHPSSTPTPTMTSSCPLSPHHRRVLPWSGEHSARPVIRRNRCRSWADERRVRWS